MLKDKGDPMLNKFVFGTDQLLIGQLEGSAFNNKKPNMDETSMEDLFRTRDTIKAYDSMALLNEMDLLTHSVEDLLFYVRKEKPKDLDYGILMNIVLESIDFVQKGVTKSECGNYTTRDASKLIETINQYLNFLKYNDAKHEPASVGEGTDSSHRRRV